MTIRKIGGHNTLAQAGIILRDDSGHRVEVVARVYPGWSVGDRPRLSLELHDLGQAVPAIGHPDPEFATRDLGRPEPPPEGISLAPDWGVSCPHCGHRIHLHVSRKAGDVIKCTSCGDLLRIPAGALTAAEARRRPTEAKP